MAYADITTRDRSPLKRWGHRQRFKDALRVLRVWRPEAKLRILDYGAGNGELIRQARALRSFHACIYEPTPELMAEARRNLHGLEDVRFAQGLAALDGGSFDFVFCLEVLEHLPEAELRVATEAIDRLLKPGGAALVGVPLEIFLPALLKGLFRMARRFGDFDASPVNILSAAVGRRVARRPSAEIAPGLHYHFHHLGFDYRVMGRWLATRFEVTERWFGPFPFLHAALNSEVYFLLRKR